jgi:hypothetical protein
MLSIRQRIYNSLKIYKTMFSKFSELKASASKESGNLFNSVSNLTTPSNSISEVKACLAATASKKFVLDVHSTLGEYLKPQFGFETLSTAISDDVTNVIENFLALCVTMADCRNTRQAAGIIFMYVKMHFHKSMFVVVKDYLLECELFTKEELPSFNHDFPVFPDVGTDLVSDDEFDVQGGTEHWINLLSSVKNNWTLVTKAPAFKKISKLLSLSAALGLCNLSKMNMDINGVRAFSIPVHAKHVSAVDFITACFDTVEYFVKGGYECFKTSSFKPFLFENLGAQQFEEEFFRIVEVSNAVKCGNLEKLTDMKENDYASLLDKLIDQSKTYIDSCPPGYERKILCDRQTTLRKLRMDFTSYRVTGKLREAPFAIYLHGCSGVGKSYVAALLSRLVLKLNGFDASDDRFMTVNEGDKFMSTAKSSVNGILIDDMGNSKPDFVEKAPTQKNYRIV